MVVHLRMIMSCTIVTAVMRLLVGRLRGRGFGGRVIELFQVFLRLILEVLFAAFAAEPNFPVAVVNDIRLAHLIQPRIRYNACLKWVGPGCRPPISRMRRPGPKCENDNDRARADQNSH